jgi:alkylation response protein AidB-like acyl-CoA dehydrogenase
MELLRALRDVAAASADGARFTTRIGHIGAELDALWALTKRNVSQAARTGVPGIGGSVFKLAFSELRQRLAELGTEIAGRASLAWDELDGGPWARSAGGPGNAELVDTWVNGFSRTIAAGTSQIQRNIVAERILGLPKG